MNQHNSLGSATKKQNRGLHGRLSLLLTSVKILAGHHETAVGHCR